MTKQAIATLMLNTLAKIPFKNCCVTFWVAVESGADAKMGSGNLSVLTNELG
jgi:hypothetical protein